MTIDTLGVTIDVPLIAVAIFFFLVSWLYAWVLFRYLPLQHFSWSLVSVIGIASVVTLVYVFVWQLRPTPPLQAVLDLAIVFAAALPGMTWVDWRQRKRLLKLLASYREKRQWGWSKTNRND